MKVVITGAGGFLGQNLVTTLQRNEAIELLPITRASSSADLDAALAQADFVIHLAGVNRPKTEDEFATGNTSFTREVCDGLIKHSRKVPLIISSSTQAAAENPYGLSKRGAEKVVADYALQHGGTALIYRLTNIFGKWCRPNYNSGVATFCHNIARGLPIQISDRANPVKLVHVDDVISAFTEDLAAEHKPGVVQREAGPEYSLTLGELVDQIESFRDMRESLILPDMAPGFVQKLYSTYLAYLELDQFAYGLTKHSDPRGSLAEFIKSDHFGQLFISRTKPGITRGDHYHHVKTEKFFVVDGQALVRFRDIRGEREVIEYHVDGEEMRVIDIPPGYTHSIQNIGESELITVFWASEIFEQAQPDTYGMPVLINE
ncbi:MAG: SDR family oxidoreductase [Gammaproteobacteria bacterium]|nr:SDR family oxidoreductase [Gammaproteobacteria bacterium]MCP4089687.1 SDR family oxidoreductase [Gammaproteobacteria bacterium]MCP4276035.1 SDR family oxidoreductase [Gammaproteobacteria bacterium]MCP4833113.1 SDR family oxidoreductase [Gammaproteobacteria bacterium]MCP4929631.1 SDR family oxidoreductase [Gammaproteobacteria bacterium]